MATGSSSLWDLWDLRATHPTIESLRRRWGVEDSGEPLARGVLQASLPFLHLVVDRRFRRRLGSLLPEFWIVDVVVEGLNGRHPAGVGAHEASGLHIPGRIPLDDIEEPTNRLGTLRSELGVQGGQFLVGGTA